jgi:hypothetical protein
MLTAGPVAGSGKRQRRTQHVTSRQANNLVAACAFAEAIGCRLNVSIDVFWLMFSGWVGDAKRLAKAQQRLIEVVCKAGFRTDVDLCQRDWCQRSHTHLHVPPWLMESGEFQIAFERSLEPEGGPTYDKAVLIKPAYAPEGKLRYMLKGMSRADANKFGVRASFQGEIEGKRVGFTENIGPRARAQCIAVATKLGRNIGAEPRPSVSISSEFQANCPRV